jgi:hypothetical protein
MYYEQLMNAMHRKVYLQELYAKVKTFHRGKFIRRIRFRDGKLVGVLDTFFKVFLCYSVIQVSYVDMLGRKGV